MILQYYNSAILQCEGFFFLFILVKRSIAELQNCSIVVSLSDQSRNTTYLHIYFSSMLHIELVTILSAPISIGPERQRDWYTYDCTKHACKPWNAWEDAVLLFNNKSIKGKQNNCYIDFRSVEKMWQVVFSAICNAYYVKNSYTVLTHQAQTE